MARDARPVSPKPGKRDSKVDGPSESAGSRGAVEVAFEVLSELCAVGRPLSLGDIATRVDYDPGNVHRVLSSLVRAGYVEREAEGRYRVAAAEVIALAGLLSRETLADIGRREGEALALQTGEAAHVAVRSGMGGVYIIQCQPSQLVRVETTVGSRALPHCSATGKAIVAHSSLDELCANLAEEFPAFTSKTITTRAELLIELERVRAQGFAIDDQELHDDVRCVAAPIFDSPGHVAGAVGVSAPSFRLSWRDAHKLAIHVMRTADAISKAFGAGHPLVGGALTPRATAPKGPGHAPGNRLKKGSSDGSGLPYGEPGR